MDSAPAGAPPLNGAPADKSPADESPLNGVPADKSSTGTPSVNGAPADIPSKGKPSVNGIPSSESAAPPEIYAVKMTAEEWKEQQNLMRELVRAVTQDRNKVDELQRKVIFPSFILKTEKLLMGADYIRKKGLNTIDADLAYGPGWLDEDDGGPTSPFAEANRHKWGIEQ